MTVIVTIGFVLIVLCFLNLFLSIKDAADRIIEAIQGGESRV